VTVRVDVAVRCLQHSNSVSAGSPAASYSVPYPLRWPVSVPVSGIRLPARESRRTGNRAPSLRRARPRRVVAFLPSSLPSPHACARTNNHEAPAAPSYHSTDGRLLSPFLTPFLHVPPVVSSRNGRSRPRRVVVVFFQAEGERQRRTSEGPGDGAVRGGGTDRPGRLRLRLPRPPQGRAQEVISPFSLVVDTLQLCVLDVCSGC